MYITCVIYRRASHAGPLAPLCFARIIQLLTYVEVDIIQLLTNEALDMM